MVSHRSLRLIRCIANAFKPSNEDWRAGYESTTSEREIWISILPVYFMPSFAPHRFQRCSCFITRLTKLQNDNAIDKVGRPTSQRHLRVHVTSCLSHSALESTQIPCLDEILAFLHISIPYYTYPASLSYTVYFPTTSEYPHCSLVANPS
jgi:hypothetical protein